MNLDDRIEWLIEQIVGGEWGDASGPDFYRRLGSYEKSMSNVLSA